MKQYDVIIIGAGLSGLTCGLLLARGGRRVLVLEQHSQAAPVVRGFRRAGLYFDSGFHYAGGLGDGGPLQLFFRHLGLTDKLRLFPFDPQGFDQLRIAASGETLVLPVGFERIREALSERFPAVATEIAAYLSEIEQTWRDFPYLNLDAELADFGMGAVHGISLAERLAVFADHPQLQSLLSMHSLLYGLPADQASSSFNAQVVGSYFHSVHGIVGGGEKLIAALLALLQEAGGEVRCQSEVCGILVSSGQVSGVRLATGEEFAATQVIATLNPAQLPPLLPAGAVRPAYLKRLNNLRQTCSAYIVFARSEHSLELLRGRNLFVQQQPGILQSGVDLPLEQRACYLAGADQGAGGAVRGLIGIVPAHFTEMAQWGSSRGPRSADYRAWKKQLSQRLLALFSRHCPELIELEVVELATPLTLRDYSRAPQGAIYGVGRWLGQYNPHPATRLPGLFLSGQAVTAPGLLGTVVAAYLTCGTILGHEQLRGELKACR
jgi:all-trans-retinol 13,14-reductase